LKQKTRRMYFIHCFQKKEKIKNPKQNKKKTNLDAKEKRMYSSGSYHTSDQILQPRGLLECQLLTQVIEASNNLFRDELFFNVKETRKNKKEVTARKKAQGKKNQRYSWMERRFNKKLEGNRSRSYFY